MRAGRAAAASSERERKKGEISTGIDDIKLGFHRINFNKLRDECEGKKLRGL